MTLSRTVAAGIDTLLDRTVAPGFSRMGPAVRRRLPTWPADPSPGALEGRTAAVTGATSGLGTATAEGLARLGARVLLVVRDEGKGAATARDLERRVPGAQVAVEVCDVADLDDVRRFADESDVDHLDVLVHNAGAMPPEWTASPQGHETSMAVHVLGPVLMTDLLSPRLTRRAGRAGHLGRHVRAEAAARRPGVPRTATTRRRRRTPAASGPRSSCCPCCCAAGAARGCGSMPPIPAGRTPRACRRRCRRSSRLTRPFLRDAEGGAETTVWLAGADPAETGRLWHDRRPRPTHLLPSTRTGDSERELMWEWVVAQTGISAELTPAPGRSGGASSVAAGGWTRARRPHTPVRRVLAPRQWWVHALALVLVVVGRAARLVAARGLAGASCGDGGRPRRGRRRCRWPTCSAPTTPSPSRRSAGPSSSPAAICPRRRSWSPIGWADPAARPGRGW